MQWSASVSAAQEEEDGPLTADCREQSDCKGADDHKLLPVLSDLQIEQAWYRESKDDQVEQDVETAAGKDHGRNVDALAFVLAIPEVPTVGDRPTLES